MQIIVLLGLPACGKGTQAAHLATDGHELASMSGLLKERAAIDDETGRLILRAMAAGDLAPDDATNIAMRDFIDRKRGEGTQSLVLDGYPRNLEQARFLDMIMAERGLSSRILYLRIADENVLNDRRKARILERIAAGRDPRADDIDEGIFWHRMALARALLGPVLAYYGVRVCHIDGLAAETEVRDDIRAFLNPPPALPAPPCRPG